ncbi:MAG TPA: hypothetical protein VD866_11185, partial [Urbifossiella sp.]|nr:hypothetical protein [Urbifossiella sp.]
MPPRSDDGDGLRYLLYAHDGVGTGHLVRTCTLAKALARRLPRAEIAVASGSPALRQFAPPGCIAISLPPHLPSEPGAPDDDHRRVMGRTRRRWRRALLRATADEFAPHVVLVDFSPAGKRDELVEPLERLAARGTAVVLGYRRIAEDPDVTKEKLATPEAERLLASTYRLLLVYAPPWVRDRVGELATTPIPHHYTGFVCRKCRLTPGEARARLGLPVGGRVVACGLGGGRDAWP